MCHFTFPISGSIEEKFSELKRKIEENNGHINGDSKSGSFDIHTPIGDVDGKYECPNNIFTLDITRKPPVVSCKKIGAMIEEALEQMQ